jgi:hypothetical protein
VPKVHLVHAVRDDVYSSSSKQHLKAERAQLVDRCVTDPILRLGRQHGRDEGREALVLPQMLVLGRIRGGGTHARVRLLPLGSFAAHRGDGEDMRARISSMAS